MTKKNDIFIKTDLPTYDIDKTGIRIPGVIQRQFGCVYCDWRKNGICPHNLKPGKVITKGNQKNVHLARSTREKERSAYICDERLEYLKSIYSGDKKYILPEEWLECYRVYQTDADWRYYDTKRELIQKELHDLKEKIGECANEDDEKKLNKLNKEYSIAEGKYMKFMRLAQEVGKAMLDRNKPKQVDVEVKHVTIKDFMDIAVKGESGEIVDADYEEVEDDE